MLNQFIYLFLTDLCRVPFQHDYKSYAETEPGYGASMLQAYLTAFNTKKDGKITEDLIKNIHESAMRFAPALNPGQYKNNWNNFSIAPYCKHDLKNKVYEIPTFTVTETGMKEFIGYWMTNDHFAGHVLAFEPTSEDNPHSFAFEHHPEGIAAHHVIGSTNSSTYKIVGIEEGLKLINQLLLKFEYQCDVNTMTHVSQEELRKVISFRMQDLITRYDNEIKQAQSEDEKLTAIVHFVQHMEQLHPFADGNIRTAYILLNKLLRDHGFSLTVLMNPNSLDGFSTAELVQMVKQGQAHYQQITQHKNGNLTLLAPAEMSETLRSITCYPQELHDINDQKLISSFINSVIKDNPESLVNNRYCFLSDKVSSEASLLLEQLSLIMDVKDKKNEAFILAINSGKYSLALRKACSEHKIEVIQTLLKFHSTLPMNLSEKSSNGNTACDWLKMNNALSSDEKKLIESNILSLTPHVVPSATSRATS